MKNETEPRDLALYETFVTWLSEPQDEFWTGQLARAFLHASTNARRVMDRALVALAQPARTEAWRRKMLACAKDHRRSLRIELEGALNEDHPNAEHCGNTCDISCAMAHKLFAWAAYLLTGATECEATTETYIKYQQTFLEPGEFEAHLDAEYRDLLAIDRVTCICGSVVWEPDRKRGDNCGNCRAVIAPTEVADGDE